MNTAKLKKMADELAGVANVENLTSSRLDGFLKDADSAGAGAVAITIGEVKGKEGMRLLVTEVTMLESTEKRQLAASTSGLVFGVHRTGDDVIRALEYIMQPADLPRPPFAIFQAALESLQSDDDDVAILGCSLYSYVERWVQHPNSALDGQKPLKVAQDAAQAQKIDSLIRLTVMARRGGALQ